MPSIGSCLRNQSFIQPHEDEQTRGLGGFCV